MRGLCLINSKKRVNEKMLEKHSFHPACNSTFVYHEDEECAQIIHDLVFQKFGRQRELYRSKRLKVLRAIFYPDITNESVSYCKVDKVNDFEDCVTSLHDCPSSLKEIRSKSGGESIEHGLNRRQTLYFKEIDQFPEHHTEIEDNFLNNSIEIIRQQINLTYTQSVGSEDISDLLSEKSILFSNTKSPSKSNNDDNNNTVIEDSDETYEEEGNLLMECIDAQDLAIQEFDNVLKFGRRKTGFVGSIPHIQAEKGRLVANLRKQVLTASLNNEFHSPLTRKNHLKLTITINQIKCDTNLVIGNKHGIPPCYYVCIIQHKTAVLSTDILAPDMHGIIEFPSRFVFEDVTNDFLIKLLLFKLQLKSDNANKGWRVSLNKRQIELPTLLLSGEQEISLKNMNKTAFPFDNEILYANFTPCINVPNRKEGNLIIQRLRRKTKIETKLVSHKRWCVLEGTDLRLYKCHSDVEYSEPIDVMSLAYCTNCTSYSIPRTLKLEFVHVYFGRMLYLECDEESFRDWFNYVNRAIEAAKTFGI